jgi:hypothetical protein
MTDGSVAPSIGAAKISAIQWVVPQAVLGGEAMAFTPWLAENLDVIAEPLGLEDLELVSTEVDVAGKRLDILAAVGADADGLSLGVAIEAQYGISDHDHLGKLVTYAAGATASHDRVLGVWLVDEAHAAHVAAVQMLNQETSERLGFVLARIRFVKTGDTAWAVDVDVVEQPNEFIRAQKKQAQSSLNPERDKFLTAVMESVRPQLLAAGFQHVSGSKGGGYKATITWPGENRWRIGVRSGKPQDGFKAMIYVNGADTMAENELILQELAEHKELVEAAVQPYGGEIDWDHHHNNNYAKVAALASCVWPGFGYASDPEEAAKRLSSFGQGVAAAAKAAMS